MITIQAITYFLLICAFLAICCSGQRMSEALDDSSPDDERRSVVNEYFDRFVGKRASVSHVCRGDVQCGDQCHQGKKYDASTTCGLVCYADPFKKGVGDTGTCHLTSNICPGASSTFCPGGSYTVIRNAEYPNYWDCDNGYGCGAQGGCCVRVAGFETGRNKHFCLKCHVKGSN